MRDGIQTMLMMLFIIVVPVAVYDVTLNNSNVWRFISHYTFIDEVFRSIARFFL